MSIDEVENLVLKHPAVHSVALVAMPDPIFCERGCAYVVLKPGQSLTFEGLRRFLIAQNIARFKWCPVRHTSTGAPTRWSRGAWSGTANGCYGYIAQTDLNRLVTA